MKRKSPPPPVATVAKGLSALRSFVDGQDEWGVRELAVALQMPPSTVHRLLARFLIEGFVSYDQGHQKYSVGFEFTRLAAAIMQRQGLSSAALPIMRELTDRTGEGVWLALFDPRRRRLAYIAETKSTHALRYFAPIGRAMHPSESACGIAILSSLSETEGPTKPQRDPKINPDDVANAKSRGFAAMRAREVDSAMMIAAPVRDAVGAPVGSIAVVVPLARFGAGQETNIGAMVQQAAERLSSRLGAKLLGGATVGSWREGSAIISDLIQQNNPSLAIIPALGGGGRNLEDIQAGSGAYALTVASSVADARAGRNQFKRKLQDLRTVMHLSQLYLVVAVRSQLKVRDVSELAKLRVSPGEQGFSGAQAFVDMLAAKRTTESRRSTRNSVLYLDYPEAKSQLEAGAIDAIVWMTSFSNPSLRELVASGSVRLMAIDELTLARMLESNPGYRAGKIARDVFPEFLREDVATIAVPTALVCRADRSEKEVHEVVRTIYEQRAVMAQLSSAYARLGPEFVLDGLTAPVHPGAEEYFRSIGVMPRYAEADQASQLEHGTKGKRRAPNLIKRTKTPLTANRRRA